MLERITDKLTNHFLTEDTLERVVDEVARLSEPFLEAQQNQKSGVSERKKEVIAKNINDVLKTAGARAGNLRSLIDDLDNLEQERQDLHQEASQMAEASEPDLLVVNDKAGIIETASSHKTFADPADPDPIREFMRLFIRIADWSSSIAQVSHDGGHLRLRLPALQLPPRTKRRHPWWLAIPDSLSPQN